VSEATGASIEALGTERGHRTLTITRSQAIPLGSPRLFHDQSRAAIRPVERQVLRILNVADFLSLTPAPVSPAAPGQSPA
jgi:predicted acetyltransferase